MADDLKVGKRELADFVYEEVGVGKKEAEQVVDAIFDFLFSAVIEGLSVGINNFGVFTSRTRTERESRNPRTGEKVFVPERRYPAFKWSPVMKREMQRRDDSSSVVIDGGEEEEGCSCEEETQ